MIDASQGKQFYYRLWIESRLETKLSDKSVFMANVVGNEILGVVGFDKFTGENIEVYMAGYDAWMTKQFIKAVFRYVFEQLNCTRCTGLVEDDNETALNIDKRLGFIQEGCMRKALHGKDVIILGMLKNECRWINNG